MEALWAGTGVFAAVKSKSYTGFIMSVVVYGIVLMLVLAAANWVLKSLGIRVSEGFIGDSQCPNGGTLEEQPGGKKVCTTAAGNVDDVTTRSGGQ